MRRAGLHRHDRQDAARTTRSAPTIRREPAARRLRRRPRARQNGLCLSRIKPTNLYELATSNYLAGGGSGFRVLQRNTTQFDTKIQQRDALIDYLRAGQALRLRPGRTRPPTASRRARRTPTAATPTFVCACAGHVAPRTAPVTCKTEGACDGGNGRCVRKDCRDEVAQFHDKRCAEAPTSTAC